MSAHHKKHPFDFKTQYGLGFDPQDDKLVVDFFCGGSGAGTKALVAMQEGRRSVICELKPEYAALARRRLDTAWTGGAAQMDMLLDQSPAA